MHVVPCNSLFSSNSEANNSELLEKSWRNVVTDNKISSSSDVPHFKTIFNEYFLGTTCIMIHVVGTQLLYIRDMHIPRYVVT